MTALVFLATSVIKIPTVNGYIHLGDGFIFLSVLFLGPVYGAFASGIGSMLSDLLSPYAHWALSTFIIKSLMALIMGFVIQQKSKKHGFISAGITSAVWLVFIAVIKSSLNRAVRFSTGNLADALEVSPENAAELASSVQWKLTAAILVFFILTFLLIYRISKKQNITGFGAWTILGMMSAGSCMIIGYYVAETILYGNPVTPVFSVPTNLVQFITGLVIALAVAPVLQKAFSGTGNSSSENT